MGSEENYNWIKNQLMIEEEVYIRFRGLIILGGKLSESIILQEVDKEESGILNLESAEPVHTA